MVEFLFLNFSFNTMKSSRSRDSDDEDPRPRRQRTKDVEPVETSKNGRPGSSRDEDADEGESVRK